MENKANASRPGATQPVKTSLTGDALVNKVAMIVIEVINLSLIFGYISAYLDGASLAYFIVFEIAAITTFFTVLVVYKKYPDKLKYTAFICFSVVYAIGVLGADTDIAFVMGFPIVVVFVLYYDYKLISRMTLTFNLIVLADIIYIVAILKHQHSGLPTNSANILMELLGTTVFLIAVRVTTKISNQNNDEKIGRIEAVAENVNNSIKSINGEIVQLNKASEAVKNAMEDINAGVSNAVEAVQLQLIQTEAIQNRIENVRETAEDISSNVDGTMAAVEEGNKEINGLVSQADRSVAISEKVTNDLGELTQRIEAMGAITKMIENIAFQTNIMALNANVEAARAGEAGRGFAVVASEISRMAAQTKKATDDITELIDNATDSLKDLVGSVDDMANVIRAEKEDTLQTSEVFTSIEHSTEKVRDNISLFIDYIGSLTDANRSIVQSVQTISATTEEVNALTNEALCKEQDNAIALESIARQVKALAEE